MAYEGPYVSAGEGLDRERYVDVKPKIHPKAWGVILRMDFDFVGIGKRSIIVSFPDEQHSDRLTAHGSDTEPSVFTQADLAEYELKQSVYAKWKQWSKGNAAETVRIFSEKITRKARLLVDDMVQRARKEWVSVLRRKKSQELLKPLREKIKKTYEAQREHFRLAKEKMPDFGAQFGEGTIEKVEAASVAKIKFIAAKKAHLVEARALRNKYRKLNLDLDSLKREIVSDGRSPELATEISNTILFARYAEDNSLPNLREEFAERLAALTMPFQVGSTLNKILDSVAAEIRDRYIELFEGMKAPPLARKTIYNRHWRGYDSNIPLVESGEFANSLEVTVL